MYYEYKCNNCHVLTAAIHSMNEEFKETCKWCGEFNWQQIYFPPALKFKGSGFYVNDYKIKK